MANMSYCRFQNTVSDFADCLHALEDENFESLSKNERRAAKQLIDLARELIELEPEIEDFEENFTNG